MSEDQHRLRVVTYNIHKARGMDRRTSPERIAEVLVALDADVLCLQEVVHAPEAPYRQVHRLAEDLPGYKWAFGTTRPIHGGEYGNLTLTRLPLLRWRSHDISKPGREPRGVLQTDLEFGGHTLHVFNAHLGTGYMERRFQARRLLSDDVLGQSELAGSRLVVGDFNEWAPGLATRLLRLKFDTFSPRHTMRIPRTYPGVFPLMTLDHCYYEQPLVLEEAHLVRTRLALMASDHLPLLATFRVLERSTSQQDTW